MKLIPKAAKRLKKSWHYLLIVVDEEGVGYFSETATKGLARWEVETLLYQFTKHQQHYWEVLRAGPTENKGMVS